MILAKLVLFLIGNKKDDIAKSIIKWAERKTLPNLLMTEEIVAIEVPITPSAALKACQI